MLCGERHTHSTNIRSREFHPFARYITIRECSLITGRGGGLQNGRGGGQVKKRGGVGKCFSHAEGGHRHFWGNF